MDLALRPGTPADWPGIAQLMQMTFHASWDDELDQVKHGIFEPDRALVATDGDEVVGHAVALTRRLTVPGATVPAAHVSMVGVAPTHRRRGLLTQLMHRQLAEVPEPVAVLWATESQIYPRFGYGLASWRVSCSIETREVRLPEPAEPGRLRTVPVEQARPELARVFEAVRPGRPGWSDRDDRWWSYRLADPASHRQGSTTRRITIHEGSAGVDGYALWRARSKWSDTGPNGEVSVDEVVAINPDAYLTLWRLLLSIDLTRSVKVWATGLDDPLLHLVDAPRRLGTTVGDGLFVRIVDLPAALAARRYAVPVDVVIEVTDPLRPANTGRWRVTGDAEKATCTRTEEPADLACGITELGAAYLGGTSLAALAAAGRVRELRPETLAPVAAGFGWPVAPSAIEIF
ncbi:MAG TPA: GNAT family N-acetyltransferase [Natronosporangium sp.]